MSCPRKITLQGDVTHETLKEYNQSLGADFHLPGMWSFQYHFIPLLNVSSSVQLFLMFLSLDQFLQ